MIGYIFYIQSILLFSFSFYFTPWIKRFEREKKKKRKKKKNRNWRRRKIIIHLSNYPSFRLFDSLRFSRARQRKQFAFEFPLYSPAPVFHEEESRFYFPSPSLPPHPLSSRRPAENKRRPFISGAYIIRFFTRPASPRMTNWNNNNGYILHTAARGSGPRLKYIYCRCPRHNRILSDKKRTDPTALPYLSS